MSLYRKVISDEDVDSETLNAQKEEMERKKRLQETQQRFLQEQEREREREIERTCSELKSLLEGGSFSLFALKLLPFPCIGFYKVPKSLEPMMLVSKKMPNMALMPQSSVVLIVL